MLKHNGSNFAYFEYTVDQTLQLKDENIENVCSKTFWVWILLGAFFNYFN